MKFTPIAARKTRWLSFALAITLAFQFVSPLVFAADPQYISAFKFSDSGKRPDLNQMLLDEGIDPDFFEWEPASFDAFDEVLDSTLDSAPLRAPMANGTFDWRTSIDFKATIFDANGTKTVLDSGSTGVFIPISGTVGDGVNKLQLNIALTLPNHSTDDPLDTSLEYEVSFDPRVIKVDLPQSGIISGKIGEEMQELFSWKLTPADPSDANSKPRLAFTLLDTAKQYSNVTGAFEMKMALTPISGGDPSNPDRVPIISTSDGNSFEIIPIAPTTPPTVKKSNGDISQIGASPYPVKWTVEVTTGRISTTYPTTQREVILEDTPVNGSPLKHTFQEAKLALMWTDQSAATPAAVPVAKSTGTGDTTLPRYEILDGGLRLKVYLPDVPDVASKPHILTYNTCIDPNYLFQNQGTEVRNDVKLTVNNQSVSSLGTVKLPTWIAKTNATRPQIDADRVNPGEMPIAWVITVNPNQDKVTIPTGTTLTDVLPKDLSKVVSVRELIPGVSTGGQPNDTLSGTLGDTLYAPGGPTTNWKLMVGSADNTSTGILDPAASPSGKLIYTYPEDKDLTGGSAEKGQKQYFVVTALVDLSSITGGATTVQKQFTNTVNLKLPNAPGDGFGVTTTPTGVTIDYSLLTKVATYTDQNTTQNPAYTQDTRDRIVTWTIRMNYVGQTIPNAVLKDQFGNEAVATDFPQELVPDTFTVYQGKFPNEGLIPGDATINPIVTNPSKLSTGSDGYSWTYDFGTISEPYTIVYKTYIHHKAQSNGVYHNENGTQTSWPEEKVYNTVRLFSGSKELGKEMVMINFPPIPIQKSLQSYDPNTHIAKWKLLVNNRGSFFKDPKLEDTLPTISGEKMTYVPGTFSVQREAIGLSALTAEPALKGFHYDEATNTLHYDFTDYIKSPGTEHKDPNGAYYPDPTARGIDGRFQITFETIVPEALWSSDTLSLTNTATLTFDQSKATATSTPQFNKQPTIEKRRGQLTYDPALERSYLPWTVTLNRKGAKIDEATIVDYLPKGMVIDFSLPKQYLPKLTAHTLTWTPDGFIMSPGGTEIPLTLGKNCFYEPDPVRPGAYNLRIELTNLLASYPEGRAFELSYCAFPTEAGTFQNKITMTGYGDSNHEGKDFEFTLGSAQVSSNASAYSASLTIQKLLADTNGSKTNAGSGIDFQLYVPTTPPTVLYTGTTDANGRLRFDKLKIGKHGIVETTAPQGYWLGDPKEFELTEAQKNLTIELTNYANQIVVVKKDAVSNLPLAGAQFRLYTKAGVAVGAAQTTDANGLCSWSKLAEGEYYVEEVGAPDGYKLSDVKRTISFKISRTEAPQNAVLTDTDPATVNGAYVTAGRTTPAFVFEFANPRSGSVSVEKRDAATNLPLAGAQFGLYKAGEAVPIESKLTDQLGKLTFNTQLADKTAYEVREQLAPDGYLMGGYVSAPFTTDFASQSAAQRLYSFTVTNMKNLVIGEKVSSTDTNKKLAGAVFGLYRADGTLISTATSDDNGRFSFMGVPAGAYIQEITPPAGYQLNTTRYTPNLTAGSTENPPLYTFKNTPESSGSSSSSSSSSSSTGGNPGGGGGGSETSSTPLLPPKPSSSSSSSSSGTSSNSESSSSRPLPEEDENGQIHPGDLTPDEVGGLLDEGYRPTRDVPFGLTREEIIKMIIDENIPLGKMPATGDATGRIIFPLVLMAAASACITGVCISKRKKRRHAK